MSDLIDRQAAIDLFPKDALEWDTNCGYIAPHFARRMIEELPSAQPVGNGRWKVSESGEMCTCSECCAVLDISIGTGCYVNGDELQFPKYCLNCGAKMESERKEE